MNYEELIANALKGRSVNSMAKTWGVPQATLDNYVKGKVMPDFDTALKIVREAGANEADAFEALAENSATTKHQSSH
jgi:DNA-binding XRE family transcriptional regulator